MLESDTRRRTFSGISTIHVYRKSHVDILGLEKIFFVSLLINRLSRKVLNVAYGTRYHALAIIIIIELELQEVR